MIAKRPFWRLIGADRGAVRPRRVAAVFDSLLAIHHAQENSLRLLRRGLDRRESTC